MSSGVNNYGQLGDTTKVNVGEPFALYKEGNSVTPFYNPINWSIGTENSGVIDSNGKLYTAGTGSYGALGNGTSSGFLGDYGSGSQQYSFQQVLTAKDVADEHKENALPDDYKAVSFSTGNATSALLLDDGTLYAAGRQGDMGLGSVSIYQNHFTRLDGRATGLPQATSSNKIKDISAGFTCIWVLYENGELYMTSSSQAGYYTLVASDIKFFDLEPRGNRVYAVNTSNQILSGSNGARTLTTLVENPVGTVTQVRSSTSGGWGYLNSNNELYLSCTLKIPTLLKNNEFLMFFN